MNRKLTKHYTLGDLIHRRIQCEEMGRLLAETPAVPHQQIRDVLDDAALALEDCTHQLFAADADAKLEAEPELSAPPPSILHNSHDWTLSVSAPRFGDVSHCRACDVHSFEPAAGEPCEKVGEVSAPPASPPPDFACATCGKPAVCFGEYETCEGRIALACGACCRHGNEDGWCKPVARLWAYAADIARQLHEQDEKLAEVGDRHDPPTGWQPEETISGWRPERTICAECGAVVADWDCHCAWHQLLGIANAAREVDHRLLETVAGATDALLRNASPASVPTKGDRG